MSVKKLFSSNKAVKGFTLVEIIVVLIILAILAAATIPSLLGFIDDAKFKTIDNEARVVRNAAQAYATEQSAGGKTDEFIEDKINGVINSNHALHHLLQNDANGTVFETKVENGKIRKFKYTKEIVDTNEDVITDKIRYAVFDDTKSSLLHATSSVTTIDAETFKANIIAAVTDALTSDDPESLKSTLTSSLESSLETSLTTNLNSSLESGMNSKISALKTNFATELGLKVYPVGSYYISHNPTSPQTYFGGTWERVNNRFLYCMGDNAKKPEDSSVALSVGGTGGSATHTHTTGDHILTVEQIPSHDHYVAVLDQNVHTSAGSTNYWLAYQARGIGDTYAYNQKSSLTGSGQAHNHGNTGSASNLPPYMAVYCWKRTA